MGADIHAVGILGTLLVPLAVVGVGFAWPPHPLRGVLGFLAATFAVGIFCLFLLMPGAPIAEWVCPSLGILAAGLFVKNPRGGRLLCWILVIAAFGLCANAWMLRAPESGYSSSPPRLYDLLNQAYLEKAAKELQSQYRPEHVLAPGPAHQIAPQITYPEYTQKTLTAQWHTPLTRLYRITETPRVIWYPGGPVSEGSQKLVWKALDPSGRGN